MPKKFISCIKEVEKKIRAGKIPRLYHGKPSSAYGICRVATGFYGSTHHKKQSVLKMNKKLLRRLPK